VFLVVDPEAKEALMTVADVMAPLVEGQSGRGDVGAPDLLGRQRLGPPDAPLQLTITSPQALRRLLWAPNQLGFARAYVSGDIQIGGDLLSALSLLEQVADPDFGPGVVIDGFDPTVDRRCGATAGDRGTPAAPTRRGGQDARAAPFEEPRCRGHRSPL
jgi:cyclopropane-fatty-acyl-phospholipid synthase